MGGILSKAGHGHAHARPTYEGTFDGVFDIKGNGEFDDASNQDYTRACSLHWPPSPSHGITSPHVAAVFGFIFQVGEYC